MTGYIAAKTQTPRRGFSEAQKIVDSPQGLVLQQIATPGVGAAIWRRSLSPGFAEWIDAVPADQLPGLRALVDVQAVENCIHAGCDSAGLPAGQMRDILASDIACLALLFAQIMQNPLMDLRLEAVPADACQRFHADQVRARLLCTYRGPGTQLALQDNQGQLTPMGQIQTGEAAILRGAFWPGREVTNLLHRSLPVQGADKIRLLLVLDSPEDPQERQRWH